VASEKRDPRISDNDIICRFVMFEVMLAWTFFHELGHIVQRHFMLVKRATAGDNTSVEISEMNVTSPEGEPDLLGQAREILADIEGLDLTLKYMVRKGIYAPASLYLLLCAQNCMFHRFYRSYEDNLELTSGRHPHPVIRNEFVQDYILRWAVDALRKDGLIRDVGEVAMPLTYTSVRSSLMAGLFWANRIEKHDGSKLPSFMTLSTQDHQAKREHYVAILTGAIREQLPIIKEMHLLAQNSIPLFESSLTSKHNQG
jgi:hypothetical protein